MDHIIIQGHIKSQHIKIQNQGIIQDKYIHLKKWNFNNQINSLINLTITLIILNLRQDFILLLLSKFKIIQFRIQLNYYNHSNHYNKHHLN